jgi:hypothetical protein
MPRIQSSDARGVFTKKLVEVYNENERIQPPTFLQSFFPTAPGDIVDTLEVSIEVLRGTERVAIDVLRGTEGNRNVIETSTEKIFIPPYFNEFVDQTHMQFYERAFRATEISDGELRSLIFRISGQLKILRDKIIRAIELQCAQVFDTGIVTLEHGATGDIDFKRKPSSKVDLAGAGGYWTTGGTNIFAQLKAAAVWLRQNGKVNANRFNVILGGSAVSAFFANATFLSRQNLFHMQLDQTAAPQRNAAGNAYHGTITGGDYIFDIWSYDGTYEDENGVYQQYWDPTLAVVLPVGARFKTIFGAPPQLLDPGQEPQTGKFIMSEFTDLRRKTREYHVESCPLVIPTQIDTIYTMKATAA